MHAQTALIVYDEIHYLRDAERGVVWEESIVLAPRTARFAFLSATIPNAREFAAWIAHTHGCAPGRETPLLPGSPNLLAGTSHATDTGVTLCHLARMILVAQVARCKCLRI